MNTARLPAALRAMAAALALALLPAACGVKSGDQTRALVIIREADDGPRLVSAMRQALALKQAGVETRVLFEAEAVLVFVRQAAAGHGEPDPRRARAPETAVYMRDWAGGPEEKKARAAQEAQTLAQLVRQVPYTICSFSAAVYGVQEELKAAGYNMTQSFEEPAELAAYLGQGYEVYVY